MQAYICVLLHVQSAVCVIIHLDVVMCLLFLLPVPLDPCRIWSAVGSGVLMDSLVLLFLDQMGTLLAACQ